MIEVNNVRGIKIGNASPEKIRSWSYGEIKKPEGLELISVRNIREAIDSVL